MRYPIRLENEAIGFSSENMVVGGNRPEAVKITDATETILGARKGLKKGSRGKRGVEKAKLGHLNKEK